MGRRTRTVVPWFNDTFDFEFAGVGLDDMLDDGETESGAAEIARARLVDPVEPFGESRQIFFRNSRAAIRDDDLHLTRLAITDSRLR